MKDILSIALYSFIGRFLAFTFGRGAGAPKSSFLWKVASYCLLSEIRLRHNLTRDKAEPFTRLFRLFTGDEHFLSRFQNVVAEDRILYNFVNSGWIAKLQPSDQMDILNLFALIGNQENVLLTLRHTDLEGGFSRSALSSDFLKFDDLETKTGRQKLAQNASSKYNSIGLLFYNIAAKFAAIFRLPSRLRAGIDRKKIDLVLNASTKSHLLSKLLSKYEFHFFNVEDAVEKLWPIIARPRAKPIISAEWLNQVSVNERVLISSLFRRFELRLEASDNVVLFGLLSELNVINQNEVAQLVHPTEQQLEELNAFARLEGISLDSGAEGNESSLRVSTIASMEDIRMSSWFTGAEPLINKTRDHILKRSYADILNILSDEKSVKSFSPNQSNSLHIFLHLAGADISGSLVKLPKTLMEPDTELATVSSSKGLRFLVTQNRRRDFKSSLREAWVELQANVDDHIDFSLSLEKLCMAYDAQPIARINLLSVRNDVFLIPNLGEILEKIPLWKSWTECSTAASVGFAMAAILTGNAALYSSVTSPLRRKKTLKNLVKRCDSYFYSVGIHSIQSLQETEGDKVNSFSELDPKKHYLCLVERNATIRPIRQLKNLTANVSCAPVIPSDASRYPGQVTLHQIEDFIPMYSEEDMRIASEIDSFTEEYLATAKTILIEAGHPDSIEQALENTHANVFSTMYREILAARIWEIFLEDAKSYDGIIFLCRSSELVNEHIKTAVETIGEDNVFVSLESAKLAEITNVIGTMKMQLGDSSAMTPRQNTRSEAWEETLISWQTMIRQTHQNNIRGMGTDDYCFHGFEHINGYFDSYVALTLESLKAFNVEMAVSNGNQALQTHIEKGYFDGASRNFSQINLVIPSRKLQEWTQGLTQAIERNFSEFDHPWKTYNSLLLKRAHQIFGARFPISLNSLEYFNVRFDHCPPKYVLTGPNQHIITRSAAYCAKNKGIPVYDFLILALTEHPRYRYPIATYSYLYDGWYRKMYETYMRMPKDKIRVSGPLFDYGQRLKHVGDDVLEMDGRTHIGFFAQSANFKNNEAMLTSICSAVKERGDVFVTVKMHPHESSANIDRYTKMALESGLKSEEFRVIHHGDAIALTNQSDFVVQSFSNIGLDAFLLGKPVITYKPPSNLKAPIMLYEKDIGFPVYTKASLTRKIKSLLDNPEVKLDLQKLADKFAKENELYLRPNNAEIVMQEILKDIGA